MRKLFILTTFFSLAPIVLLLGILLCVFASYHQTHRTRYAALPMISQTSSVAYAALPTEVNMFRQSVQYTDGRVESVRQFLAQYDSPLEPYAQQIVDTADAYGLDYRLVPAIAMQESNLCKKIPEGSHNCWGYGIYGGKVTRFSDYEEAIRTVTKTLATKYKEHGLDSPNEIMTRWTPSSNGSWAHGVNHFMNQL